MPSLTRPPCLPCQVVRVALQEGLVTPHTSAVGVMLRPDPADPSKVTQVEVPLAVPAGRTLWQQEQEMLQRGAAFGGMGGVMACAMPAPVAFKATYKATPKVSAASEVCSLLCWRLIGRST